MPIERVWEETGAAAVALLQLVYASADVFPPLKAAALGVALHITGIVSVRLSVTFVPLLLK